MPALWVPREAMAPAGPWAVCPQGECPARPTPEARLGPPPSPPVPSTQLSRHYPAPPGPVTARGSGDALGGGARPSPLPPPALLQGQPPQPPRGHLWGEVASPHPFRGMEAGVGTWVPHNSLYICINKWDFNGAPPPSMLLSLCDSLCLLSWPSTLFLYLFHSFFGFHPEPSGPLQGSCL